MGKDASKSRDNILHILKQHFHSNAPCHKMARGSKIKMISSALIADVVMELLLRGIRSRNQHLFEIIPSSLLLVIADEIEALPC